MNRAASEQGQRSTSRDIPRWSASNTATTSASELPRIHPQRPVDDSAPSRPIVRLEFLTRVAEQPLHRALGLTDGEFDRIQELLEREPNHFELAVFSLLWSEHCGYKHSALLLKRFPTDSPRVLQGPGENAGVVDLGDGEAVAFKVESHNHPSAVEPFQGAATGIGGILRDIIAMGARPVALLDGLRFGEPGWMFERAVAGIGHYGNCVGVPTVGGETVFDPSYADNCLVNAMCVGLLPTERVLKAQARGTGNVVLLYGATTGRDGIGGASVLASQELGEEDADKRPSVQIGDPFTGKKLIESSLELVERDLVVSLQDCGAAGLASSLAEMARGGGGIDVHLDRVPLREEEMEPWEIMISESQERMVAVVSPEQLAAVEEVCDRWELAHARIGEVTETAELRAFFDGELVGAIPAAHLTDEAPRYDVPRQPRPPAEPAPAAGGAADAGGPARAARLAEPPQPRLGLPPLRPARRLAHGSPAGPRRRRSPPAPLVPGARGQPRRLRPDRAARSAHRRSDGRDRSGAQRRLRRRRAARDHRLPQLREPREAGDRLGARRGDRGHVRRLRGARDPGRVRQRLALQRHGRPLDPPHAGRRLRRSRRRRARRAGRLARGRRDLPRRRAASSRSTAPSTRPSTASSVGDQLGSTLRERPS